MTRDNELLRRGDVREYVRNFERDFNIPWREQLSKGIDALPAAAPAPTPFVPLAVPEVKALVEALKVSTEVLSQCSFQTIRINRQYIDREEVVANSIAALRQIGGEG